MRKLFTFKGGVKPQTNKTATQSLPIALAPLVERYFVPLHQSIGGHPKPLVAVGDKVLKGQCIGAADGWISSAVHAPTSGTVRAVAEHVAAHPSGLPTVSVEIVADGDDTWGERQPLAIDSLTPESVRERLRDAGIVGLGGAVFPSHAKLTAAPRVPMEELVINGAECEPYITCDDLLMRERAADVVRGVAIFRQLLQPKRVLIGIEDNKPEAVAALQATVAELGEDFEVIAVPTRYPAGGAKQLIRVLTGKEIPAAKRSTDLGVQCFNVATAYAAARLIHHGEPLISRIVTLAGNVARPRNWDIRIGTPLSDFVGLGEPLADTNGYLMGGPMMGFKMPSPDAPLVKASNCIIATSDALFPPPPPEMPCIRCGECARACPHELQPFELYWHARSHNFGKTQEYHLFDCIECGCCSYVCPSRIPLVQYFRFAKSEIWARERDKKAAEGAKERFEFRTLREEREKAEKAEKLARAAAAQAAKKAAEAAAVASGAIEPAPPPNAPSAPVDAQAAKKATIAAAMARAQKQREAQEPANTRELTPAQAREVAEVDARRQAAGLDNGDTGTNATSSTTRPASAPSKDSSD